MGVGGIVLEKWETYEICRLSFSQHLNEVLQSEEDLNVKTDKHEGRPVTTQGIFPLNNRISQQNRSGLEMKTRLSFQLRPETQEVALLPLNGSPRSLSQESISRK